MKQLLIALLAVAVVLPLTTAHAKKSGKQSGKHHRGETFQVAADCKISTPGNKHASLSDLKAGEKVKIAYLDKGGSKVAERIHVKAKHAKGEKKASANHKSKHKKAGKKHHYLNAKGTIVSVGNGSITIKPHHKQHSKQK
jgi:hypothetical protein